MTSKYPLLFISEKVFLDKDKIIFHKGKNTREIYYKEIVRIKVKPMIIFMSGTNLYFLFGRKIPVPNPNKPKPFGWGWLYYKTNDLHIIFNSDENLKLHNITISGTEELLNKIKSFNSNIVISKVNTSIFNADTVAGLIRVQNPILIPIFFAFIFITIIFYFCFWY